MALRSSAWNRKNWLRWLGDYEVAVLQPFNMTLSMSVEDVKGLIRDVNDFGAPEFHDKRYQ